MADSTIKPDDTNDLVLQNNDGSSKLELNEDQTVKITTGTDAGEDFTVNTTQLVVEGDTGYVGIGTSAPTGLLQIAQTGTHNRVHFDTFSTTDAEFTSLCLRKSSSASIGTFSTTSDGEQLGEIIFQGVDNGSNVDVGAGIQVVQVGSAGYRAPCSMTFITSSTNAVNSNVLVLDYSGNVGIGTASPGQILDCNAGSGNMIADGYDTHSLAVYKENIEDASGYLDKVLACPAQKWNPKPFVSAEEIKKAVLDEFGEDVVIEEAVEAQDAVYEDAEVTPAVEAADAVMGERAVTETIETGSYVNLAGETITETEERNVTEEVTETVVERQTGEDGITREVEVERTVQRNVMEACEIKPGIEAVDAVIEQRLVSEAIEAKDAVYEKQYSVWDELFPEDNSHRQKALYNMPEGDLKTWIDDWCAAKRVEMRPEDKWQKKRLGLVADAELTAEHLPEVISINDDGEPTGIDTMTYIGILHNAVQELSTKVTTLENA